MPPRLNETQYLADLDACPQCGATWAYDQGGKRYSYIMAVIEHDRCVRWRCPACANEWPRGAEEGTCPNQ